MTSPIDPQLDAALEILASNMWLNGKKGIRGQKQKEIAKAKARLAAIVEAREAEAEHNAYGKVYAHLGKKIRYVKVYGIEVTHTELQRQAMVVQNHKSQLRKWLELQQKKLIGQKGKD